MSVNEFRKTLLDDYMIFSSAFAFILAGNFQNILSNIIDNVMYPLVYQLTGWKPEDDMKLTVHAKEVINSVLRFALTISVVYLAYIYRGYIVASIGTE